MCKNRTSPDTHRYRILESRFYISLYIHKKPCHPLYIVILALNPILLMNITYSYKTCKLIYGQALFLAHYHL